MELHLSARRKGVPSLSCYLWGLETNDKGHLAVSGWDVVDLAETYGTPLHVIHAENLRARCREILDGSQSSAVKHEAFFSYKTNPVPGLIRIVHEEGVGAEVISDYELWLAYELAVPPERIVYNGVAKTDWGLELAAEKGVRVINIDSLHEIDRVNAAAEKKNRSVDVGLRVLPG